jgi:CRISPR-associated protein Cmr6
MSRWNDYEAPNLGLLFYKQIYHENIIKSIVRNENGELFINVPKEEKTSPFDDFYKDLYAKKLNKFSTHSVLPFNASFKLKTTYPGLLVGSGYAHDTKAKGDFKIGFFFDHTTGLPVIPGSSVKGVCRSVFELDKGKKTAKKSLAAVDFIFNELLEKYQSAPDFKYKADIEKIKAELNENKLKHLVKEIFGQDKEKGKDIFFDAILNTDITKPFLANDFITPHKHKSNPALDPFTNPNPIQFLKVRSEVTFEFRFSFTNTEEWTKEIKELFFKQEILTFGIGAKTNIGYGQFEAVNEPKG